MKVIEEKIKNAICNNDFRFIEFFIKEYGVNYSFKDEDNDSLLFYAISDSGSDSYKIILNNKPNIDFINSEGESIYHSLVYSGQLNRLNELLIFNKPKINVNHQSKDGITALSLAITLNNFDFVEILLSLGANPNILDKNGMNSLHIACIYGNIEIVKKVMEKKIDLFEKSKNGNVALAIAVNNNFSEIVKLLFEKMY